MTIQFSTPIEVRYSDLDPMGHVNSAVYFTYLETARLKLLEELKRTRHVEVFEAVVASQSCEYKIPILWGDEVMISVSVVHVGNSSFGLEYRLHDSAGKLFALARSTMVCFDRKKNASTPLPQWLQEMYHSPH